MTVMRSVEPLTGIDAFLAQLFPFLNGTDPRPGEHGTDRAGRIYSWDAQHGWLLVLDSQAGHHAPQHEAEAG